MIISGFIVADNPFLDTFRRHVERQMNDPVLTPLGCKDSKFHRIQCASCIASGEICEKLSAFSLISARNVPIPFSLSYTARFSSSLISSFSSAFNSNTLERDRGSVHLKIWILRRRADQRDRSVLHIRKQVVRFRPLLNRWISSIKRIVFF